MYADEVRRLAADNAALRDRVADLEAAVALWQARWRAEARCLADHAEKHRWDDQPAAGADPN